MYSPWQSVLHDHKFDNKAVAKLASTRYSFTCPTCSVLQKHLENSGKKNSKKLKNFLGNFTLNLGKV